MNRNLKQHQPQVMFYYFVVLFLCCLSLGWFSNTSIVVHAVQNFTVTTPCDGGYSNSCTIVYQTSLPSIPAIDLDHVVDYVVLPFDIDDYGISVTSAHSGIYGKDNCQVLSLEGGTTRISLKPPLWYILSNHGITTDDERLQQQAQNTTLDTAIRSYVNGQRGVECRFTMNNPIQDVLISPKPIDVLLVNYNVTLYDTTKKFHPIDIRHDFYKSPAFLYTPGVNQMIGFQPTNSYCTEQDTIVGQHCIGNLNNIPRSFFPLTMQTSHELLLDIMRPIMSTQSCPMVIEEIFPYGNNTVGYNTEKFYNLILSPTVDINQQSVSCVGFVIEKSPFSIFNVLKIHELPIQLPPSPSNDDNGDNDNNPKIEYSSLLASTLYSNFDIYRTAIETKLLSDCYTYFDSRCTMLFVFPFAPDSAYAAAAVDLIVTPNYLNHGDYFINNAQKEIALSTTQRNTRVSWLSTISPLQGQERPVDCTTNLYYLEQNLDIHQTNYVVCFSLRKTLQGSEMAADYNVPIGSTPNAQSQLLRITFSGYALQGQYQLIHFSSTFQRPQTTARQMKLIDLPLDKTTDTFSAPLLIFTTPIQMSWDDSSCGNGNVPFCKATLRSRWVGAPTQITFSRTSTFLKNHRIDRFKCNTLSIGVDIETHTVHFPAQQALVGSVLSEQNNYIALTTAATAGTSKLANFYQTERSYQVVLLQDPYTKEPVDWHECEIYYSKKYVYSPQALITYNNNTNVNFITTQPAIRGMVIKKDDDVVLQRQIDNLINSTKFQNLYPTIEDQILALKNDVVLNTFSTLYPFVGYNIDDAIDSGLLPSGVDENGHNIILPGQFDYKNGAYNIKNQQEFIIIESVREHTTVAARVNSFATTLTLNRLAHVPLFVAQIKAIEYIIDPATTTNNNNNNNNEEVIYHYNYILHFKSLTTPYDQQLLTFEKHSKCDDQYEMFCDITIRYPSIDWLHANGQSENTLQSFTLFFDGADYTQNFDGQAFNLTIPSTSTNGLIPGVMKVTTLGLTYDELLNLGITPIRPLLMKDVQPQVAAVYFVVPPTFNTTQKQFVAFNFELQATSYDELNPYYKTDTSLQMEMILSYRKTIQNYFKNEYQNAKMYLLSWGRIFAESQYHHVIEQPQGWYNNINIGSHFQPDYVMSFDETTCGSPYASQCRVFVNRKQNIKEEFYFFLSLWSFSMGNAWFLHPEVQGTRIYYVTLPAAGTIIPLAFPIRMLDPTAWDAQIRVVQFDRPVDISQPENLLITGQAKKTHDYSFYGKFPFEHPTIPQLQSDCTDLSMQYCTIEYLVVRPIYAPMSTSSNYIISRHNITNRDHIYVPLDKLQLTGTELVAADYTYTLNNFIINVLVDGDINHPAAQNLKAKVVVTLTGTKKHPDHLNDALELSVEVTRSGQHPAIWFNGPRDDSRIAIRISLQKTNYPIPRQMRIIPTNYHSIKLLQPGLEIKGLPPITLEKDSFGYLPLSWGYYNDCLNSPIHTQNFHCTLTMQLRGTINNPIRDFARVLPLNFKLYSLLSPHTIYFTTFKPTTAMTTEFINNPVQTFGGLSQHQQCANLTNIVLDFTSDIDIPEYNIQIGDKITRLATVLQINPLYHNRSHLCYAMMSYSPALQELWNFLMNEQSQEKYSQWYPTKEDLQIGHNLTLSYYLNQDIKLPHDFIQKAFTGYRYELTDDIINGLTLPNVNNNNPNDKIIAINQFKSQFTKMIKADAMLPLNPRGFPQHPDYIPMFQLPNVMAGPALNLKQYGKTKVNDAFISTLDLFISGTLSPLPSTNPSIFTQYLSSIVSGGSTSNNNIDTTVEHDWIMYEYTFNAPVTDLKFDQAEFDFNEQVFPCITSPSDGARGKYFNVVEYLMIWKIITKANPTQRIQIENGNTYYINPEELKYNNFEFPQTFIEQFSNQVQYQNNKNDNEEEEEVDSDNNRVQLLNDLNIMGLFWYHVADDQTRLYFNREYLNTQIVTHSWDSKKEVQEILTKYLETQLSTFAITSSSSSTSTTTTTTTSTTPNDDNYFNLQQQQKINKPTTKSKSCYFWAPSKPAKPYKTTDVKHHITIALDTAQTVGLRPEHFTVNMNLFFATYHNPAFIRGIDGSIIATTTTGTSGRYGGSGRNYSNNAYNNSNNKNNMLFTLLFIVIISLLLSISF